MADDAERNLQAAERVASLLIANGAPAIVIGTGTKSVTIMTVRPRPALLHVALAFGLRGTGGCRTRKSRTGETCSP
jgi:hypothetical protein